MTYPAVFYREVADVYRREVEDAQAARRRPVPGYVIADTWGVPLPTARYWVRRAARTGLLEAEPGKTTGYTPVCRGCPCHCPPRTT